ncbi:MAG: ribonuclease P protein component [Peptococcia bacterium]
MLPQRYRLKKNDDFRKIYKYGRSMADSYLVLYIYFRVKKQFSGNPRIGFSVSKRLGSAVSRNKIKRKMRAALIPYLQFIVQDVDIIFVARKKIKGISFRDVEKSMGKLLKKAGLIEKKYQSSDIK